METPFDYLSVLLFIASAGLFFYRLQREDEPLAPYIAVSILAALGNYAGDAGETALAATLLFAGTAITAARALAPVGERQGPKA